MRGNKRHIFKSGRKAKNKTDALMLCVYMYYFSQELRSIATQWYGGRPGMGFTNSTSHNTVPFHVFLVFSVLVALDVLMCVLVALANGTRNPI